MATFTGFTADQGAVNAGGAAVDETVAESFADDAVRGGAPAADERSGSGDLPSPFVPDGGAASSAPSGATAAARGISTPMGSALALTGTPSSKPSLNDLAVLPGTLTELKNATDLDPIIIKLLTEIGAEDETEVADLACLAESDWETAINKLVADGALKGPLQRAKAVRVVRSFLVRLGAAPPALGAPLAARPPEPSPSSSSRAPAPPGTLALAGSLVPAPAPPVLDDLMMLSFRDYLDQGLKGSCAPLASAVLLEARARYEERADAEPRESCTPSAEQLACLSAVLRAGRVPYVDFGVFNKYGPRLARFQDFDAQIIVEGQVVTKRVAAPSTLDGWMDCWELFSVAMVSLGAASIGALKTYSDALKELVTFFPNKWPVIVTTDLVVRTERWARMKERCDRLPPAGYDPARPWNFVIPAASYGSADLKVQAWWSRMLVLPATLTQTASQAAQLVNALEGNAVPAAAAAFPVLTDRPRRRSRTPPRSDRDRDRAGGGSGEICMDYNLKRGKCVGKGPCVNHRRHDCPVCGDRHRGLDHHSSDQVYAALGKVKGKGKGKKGQKGKKGDAAKKGDGEPKR